MRKHEYPPLEYVRQRLFVENGTLIWKPSPQTADYEMQAGWTNNFGRAMLEITHEGKTYTLYNHVVIWALENGEWPPKDVDVDHKDGDLSNDKIENLRLANRSESMCNRGTFKNNTSGCKGVYWHKRVKRWVAQVRKDKKKIFYKYFETFEEARDARIAEAKKAFGEFYRES